MQAVYAVRDLEQSLRFYEQAFGWPRNDRVDYANYVELLPPDGGALGLYERGGFAGTVGAELAELPGDTVAPGYVYVRVDDVDDAAARVAAAGGRPLSPPRVRSWGERAAWFADPDGNVVAVGEPIRAAPPEPAA